jgi:hypothetical protein
MKSKRLRANAGIWAGKSIMLWAWRSGQRLDEECTGSTPNADMYPADKDCSAFRSRRQAQDFYEKHGRSDPHGLDWDGDGSYAKSLGW